MHIRSGDYVYLDDVVRELVARDAYVEDPRAARTFVLGLPTASNGGSSGLHQSEFDNDNVDALARSALVPAKDDLTDVQAVIAHLPETDDGVRNKLITGFYCDVARRADAILSVGDATTPPGNTWLDYAPWASFAIGKVISADNRAVWGFDPPTTAREAAADGNQWIFNDITSKFAAFVEMLQSANGHPSAAALTAFFTGKSSDGTARFGRGGREIRAAFLLYAASLRETDPARRQKLMFRANAMVAIHEQAGVDDYLQHVLVGPLGIEVYDWKASEYMDMTMGDYVLEVNKDLDTNGLGVHSSALIDDNKVLGLDPGRVDLDDVEGGLGLALPALTGWEDTISGRHPETMDISVASWQTRKGKVAAGSTPDDSLKATGVGSWGDYGDRMWFLFRLFEQLHTDASIPPPGAAQPASGVAQPPAAAGGATVLGTGYHHSCVVLSGSTWCWGLNDHGQLGNGTATNSTRAVRVRQLAPLTAISPGDAHTCGLESQGGVECWGSDHYGQLGPAASGDSDMPVTVSGLGPVSAISVGGGDHTCALLKDQTVRCWGRNDRGQLGNGATANSPTPVAVTGLTHVVAVMAGSYSSCALVTGGQVRCWGANEEGQLGNGTTVDSSVPVAVDGVSGATAISPSFIDSCALVPGSLRCWGDNGWGELGDGTKLDELHPVTVVGIPDATVVSGRGNHTCALRSSGAVMCWGRGEEGQLGNGRSVTSPLPVYVTGLSGVTQVSVGGLQTCALTSGGRVKCWGDNSSGALGDGTLTNSNTPVGVVGLP
jgi:alpha-tubulin suppressor-like RCC1 family protein